jgi:protein-disulfide isomerase
MDAAIAATCAGLQDRFWPMHDLLFAQRGVLDPEAIVAGANAINLDPTRFADCVKSRNARETVSADLAIARRLGLSVTPVFLVGMPVPKNQIKVSQVLRGVRSFAEFAQVLDGLEATATGRVIGDK